MSNTDKTIQHGLIKAKNLESLPINNNIIINNDFPFNSHSHYQIVYFI